MLSAFLERNAIESARIDNAMAQMYEMLGDDNGGFSDDQIRNVRATHFLSFSVF